jgi:hypothetical protein
VDEFMDMPTLDTEVATGDRMVETGRDPGYLAPDLFEI